MVVDQNITTVFIRIVRLDYHSSLTYICHSNEYIHVISILNVALLKVRSQHITVDDFHRLRLRHILTKIEKEINDVLIYIMYIAQEIAGGYVGANHKSEFGRKEGSR